MKRKIKNLKIIYKQSDKPEELVREDLEKAYDILFNEVIKIRENDKEDNKK